jgi:hypothetical protein
MHPLTAVCLTSPGEVFKKIPEHKLPVFNRRLARVTSRCSYFGLIRTCELLFWLSFQWMRELPNGNDRSGWATNTALHGSSAPHSVFRPITRNGIRAAEIMAMAVLSPCSPYTYAYQTHHPTLVIPMALHTGGGLNDSRPWVAVRPAAAGLMAVAIGGGPGGWLVLRW